jgi:hypothetical protein
MIMSTGSADTYADVAEVFGTLIHGAENRATEVRVLADFLKVMAAALATDRTAALEAGNVVDANLVTELERAVRLMVTDVRKLAGVMDLLAIDMEGMIGKLTKLGPRLWPGEPLPHGTQDQADASRR